jgi:hypothetical protein
MANKKPGREQLERRRSEILDQLGKVNDDLRTELDRDTEEQAIQVEQDEVAITMENQLRQELDEIEELLREESGSD